MRKPTFAGVLKAFVLLTAAIGIAFFVFALVSTTVHKRIMAPYPKPGHADGSDTINIQKTGPQTQERVLPVVQKEGLHPGAKIQVAILLDVSNSMDGLIDQARVQLWNMVKVMGQVRCENLQPKFELALYEYGRSNNDQKQGYVKQLYPFTSDLDRVSSTLFGITTNGGEEYCPEVILQSADQLPWDNQSGTYRVIFIAGNESFRQGNIPWIKACQKAKEKGIILNTIFCGSREEGLAEYWNLGAECGSGSFTNINADEQIEDIPTPYDTTLIALNEKLNATYVAYGARGEAAAMMQADVDSKNFGMSRAAGISRVEVKSKSSVYTNHEWDLVDAIKADSTILSKTPQQELPKSFKGKSKKEMEEALAQKGRERALVQRQIAEVSLKRSEFLLSEKQGSSGSGQTLQSEIEKMIRAQVKRYNMEVVKEN